MTPLSCIAPGYPPKTGGPATITLRQEEEYYRVTVERVIPSTRARRLERRVVETHTMGWPSPWLLTRGGEFLRSRQMAKP